MKSKKGQKAIYLDNDLREKIEKHCDQRAMKFSGLVQLLLRQYAEENGIDVKEN